ncbi:hypothetical protein KI387_032665 [Taxus chinensis]|uniref:Uncharacterized protein n=1 Tax=Taxus chinensis TaxID=29808 RepID=A0AA38F3S7_TAXCH|nr:hypothetical protein KI387_032665 [Taxus chinensis]
MENKGKRSNAHLSVNSDLRISMTNVVASGKDHNTRSSNVFTAIQPGVEEFPLLKRKEESKAETEKIDEEMHILMKLTEQISLAMDEILMEDCLDVQKQMLLQLFLANREAAYRLQQLQHLIHDLAVCERNSAAAFKKAQLDIAKRMGETISLFNPTHGEKELNQT